MALSIILKTEHKQDPTLRRMMEDYILEGGKIIRGPNRDRILPFDSEGELEITQQQYNALKIVPNIRFENGHFYHVFQADEIKSKVPGNWPESTASNNEQLTYKDYFRAGEGIQTELEDGSFLFLMQRRDGAPTYGMHLTDHDRKIFEETLGDLLVAAAGEKLKPAVQAPQSLTS